MNIDKKIIISELKEMLVCRKEHSLINLGQYVYALGGYGKLSNCIDYLNAFNADPLQE